ITAATITLGDAVTGGAWTSSDGSIASIGSSSGVITGGTPGVATITYTVNNGCGAASTTKTVSVTSSSPEIRNNDQGTADEFSIQLYPNPTSGTFNINVPEKGILNIYSLDGKEVSRYNIEKGESPVTLPNTLSSGIYMCIFHGENGNSAVVRLVYD